ncbi:hypothetical protein ACERZ8_00960 [Tateyamaria armeniaca]|uniref:Uncharacterized protein n=1 Tax=Tateyamaria armeniaca TaxID=2518930 RepID=A0ABW8UP53_9RHOB
MKDRRTKNIFVTQFVLLALVLLVFVILHTTILRTALSLFGLRHDAPQIVLVENECGTFLPPAAFRTPATDLPVFHNDCDRSDEARVWYTVPSGGRSALFLNENLVDAGSHSEGLLNSSAVRLRHGVNRLAVLAEHERAFLPFASLNSAPRYVLPSDKPQGLVQASAQTRPGRVFEMWISHAADPSDPMVLGRGTTPDNEEYAIWVASDCGQHIAVQARVACFETANAINVNATGYGITEVDVQAPVDFVSEVYRHLTISVKSDGLELSFEACLLKDLPLQRTFQANDRTLAAAEFLRRTFGLQLREASAFGIEEFERQRARLSDAKQTCEIYTGRVTLPLLPLSFDAGNFLSMNGDRVTVSGVGPLFEPVGRLVTLRDSTGAWIWEGSLGDHDALSIPDWDAPPADATQETEADAPQSVTLISFTNDISALMPASLRALSEALAAGLPVLAVAFAAFFCLSGRLRLLVPPVVALASFVVAMAVQPLMLEMAQLALSVFRSLRFSFEATFSATANEYVPLAVLSVALMTPVARHSINQGKGRERSLFQRLLVFAYAAALMVIAALALSMLAQPQWASTLSVLTQADTVARPLALTVTFWTIFSLGMMFLLLRRFLEDTIAPRAAWRIAALGAASIVLLPVVSAFSGAADLISLLSGTPHQVFGQTAEYGLSINPMWDNIAVILRFAAFISVVGLILQSFGEVISRIALPLTMGNQIAEAPNDHFRAKVRMRSYRVAFYAGLAALFLAVLSFNPLQYGNPDLTTIIFQVLGLFHDFAVLAALLVPLMLLYWENNLRGPERAFEPDDSVEPMLAAALASYVALVPGSSPSFLIGLLVVLLSFTLFMRLALRPQRNDRPLRSAAHVSGKNLVRAIEQDTLIAKRAAKEEATYSEGEITWDDLCQRKAELARVRSMLQAELGQDVAAAKFRLLNNGPRSSPFKNAMLGLAMGMGFTLVFDITRSLDPETLLSIQSRWWALFLNNNAPTGTEPISPQTAVIAQFQLILRSFLFWPLLGFVFGALFHRIRGDDGFSKAIVMAATLVVPVSIVLLWTSGGPVVTVVGLRSLFVQIVWIGLFLMAVGVLAFDTATIIRNDLHPRKIATIYGVRTLVSYATIVGLATAFQGLNAILALID